MIYHKIGFLIVFISVVCFSAAVNTPQEAVQDYNDCCHAMNEAFTDVKTSVTKCIQHGIMRMKLCGKDAFTYHRTLEKYYKLFYNSVYLHSVPLPETFCSQKRFRENKKACLDDLKIFLQEEEEIADSFLQFPEGPSESPSDERMTKKAKYSEPQDPSGASSSEGSNEDILRSNVLKNALYFHVIYYKSDEYELPEDPRYFHLSGSYGYLFLIEIARTFQFKKGSLTHPSDFCHHQFISDLSEVKDT